MRYSDTGICGAIVMTYTKKLSFEDYLALEDTGYEGCVELTDGELVELPPNLSSTHPPIFPSPLTKKLARGYGSIAPQTRQARSWNALSFQGVGESPGVAGR